MTTQLPPGNWRLDPFRRIQVWVPDEPGETGPDLFDELEAKATAPPSPLSRYRTAVCIDCGGSANRKSKRCLDCYIADCRINAAPNRPPITNPFGLHDPIDTTKVQTVLDGKFVKCTRPERFEVLRRWEALGRTDASLVELTGWNVPRDRRYIKSIQAKEAA